MGRELMRVPMDFDCPIGETWPERFNPYHPKVCPECDGVGRDASYQAFGRLVSLVMLAGSDSARHGSLCHLYFASTPVHGVSAPRLHEVTTSEAGRQPSWIGHDACDRWAATNAILKAAGLDPETWGICPACNGEGYAPGQEELIRLCEEWEMPDPPLGEGYQIWQTVSEGGPVSPVFATPEELAAWMVAPGNDTSVTRGRTYEQWLAFIHGPGWAPSMMTENGRPLR